MRYISSGAALWWRGPDSNRRIKALRPLPYLLGTAPCLRLDVPSSRFLGGHQGMDRLGSAAPPPQTNNRCEQSKTEWKGEPIQVRAGELARCQSEGDDHDEHSKRL